MAPYGQKMAKLTWLPFQLSADRKLDVGLVNICGGNSHDSWRSEPEKKHPGPISLALSLDQKSRFAIWVMPQTPRKACVHCISYLALNVALTSINN
jgi:hypothetical protein